MGAMAIGLAAAGPGWLQPAAAQSAPPPPPAAPSAAVPPPPPPRPMGFMHGPDGHGPDGFHGMPGEGMPGDMHGGMHGPGMRMMGGPGWMRGRHPFGLIFTAPDRNLSPADVQTIVQGFLLWHGNHTWKVANVQAQEGLVAFSLTTPDGSVIASFTMDPHDGRVQRTG